MPWNPDQIMEALAIAEATSLRHAARTTGIPFGTLSRHSAERAKQARAAASSGDALTRRIVEANQTKITGMAIEARQSIMQAAIERTAGEVSDKVVRMAEELYLLADKAIKKVDRAISDPAEGGATGAKDPAWVRSLVGVMAQSIEKAQLLAGRPSMRTAMDGTLVNRQEHHVTHILENPDALAMARALFRSTAGTPLPALAGLADDAGRLQDSDSLDVGIDSADSSPDPVNQVEQPAADSAEDILPVLDSVR